MEAENEVLKDFYLLSDYLKKEGKIENLNKYKKDFSAFLLHAIHIKAYDIVTPFCKNKKILDVGCFIGYGETRIFSQAEEIVAIDSDNKALEYARKNRFIPNAKFEKLDARQLPFSDETFDIVIAFQLIEHIPPNEVSSFLSEVSRVLKGKGLLFIATPNRKFRLVPFQRPFNPGHYQEFTAKGLLKILKSIFGNVQIMGIRAKGWIEEIERKRVRKSPYRGYIRDPLYRLFNIALPTGIKVLVKKTKSKMINHFSLRMGRMSDSNDQFNNLFQQFSMNDFYLESHMLDKAMDLFAICKK
jgi:2-polyprenyl-3-methyl-5-hydroxy-6-metoxy-1,4-benzoquinol methylase